MTSTPIPKPLRELVRQRAGGRCEYCQTPEWLNGLPGEVDHIIPRAHGGLTTADNLCFACSACNGYKQAKTHGRDPENRQAVLLFHPRRQNWREHFAWSQDGTQVIGLTPCGRATIEALHLNHPLVAAARAIWVQTGHHPPA
jgi:hypothetical protein